MRWEHYGWRRSVSSVLLIIALSIPIVMSNHQQSTNSHLAFARLGFAPVPAQPLGSALPFDEQVGMTFTQSVLRLDFNVTAVAQTGPDGDGPGYLVSGLTSAGYWYQVGLSYHWPSNGGTSFPGFSMNYEVFDNRGNSTFPANGGGIDSLRVNPRDIVLCSLYFSGGNVVMRAMDWNTTSSASERYTALGSTSFIGLPTSVATTTGFFTGLMTEEYHASPYSEAGTPTFYTTTEPITSPVWQWIDEWNTDNGYSLFSDNTTSAVQLQTSSSEYFSSYGTAEVASAHGLVTGLTPITIPVTNPGRAIGYSNHEANVPIMILGQNGTIVRFTNMTITANFSTYNASSSVPFTLQGSSGSYNVTMDLPSGLSLGNFTITVHVSSWQLLEPQAQEWIRLSPLTFNETLTVTNHPAPAKPAPTRPPSGSGPNILGGQSAQSFFSQIWAARSVIIPAVLAYLILASLIVITVERRHRDRPISKPPQSSAICPMCGSSFEFGSLFCPNCGTRHQPPPAG